MFIPAPDYDFPFSSSSKKKLPPTEPTPDYEEEELKRIHGIQPSSQQLPEEWPPSPAAISSLSNLPTMKRSHIRNIGVPLLPPLPSRLVASSGAAPEENAAFLRHLANHRNFDTVKSLRSCNDCPICRIFLAQQPTLSDLIQEDEDELRESTAVLMPESSSPFSSSSNHPTHRRPDVRGLFHSP